MPNPSAAKKTVSARKKLLAGILVVAVAIVIGVVMLASAAGPKLRVNGRMYHLDVAATEMQQEKGLGGRDSIPADHGMLFTYTKPGKYCYWMKDMHFPLDIIWLDAEKHIVKIEPNLSPTTYPQTYCPETNAQYVIELNAGQVRAAGMYTGQQLKF